MILMKYIFIIIEKNQDFILNISTEIQSKNLFIKISNIHIVILYNIFSETHRKTLVLFVQELKIAQFISAKTKIEPNNIFCFIGNPNSLKINILRFLEQKS